MKLPNLPQLDADKANHLAYGAALACIGALAHSPLAGALLCAGFAIVWEVLQWALKVGHASPADAAITMAGGALVLAPVVLPTLGAAA